MTIANDIQQYIEGLLHWQGRYAGEPFKLHGWQRRFLQGAFSQDDDAGCSLARGGGKSTFVSALATAAVAPGGPLVEKNAEVVIVASSFEQGHSSIFRAALSFMEPVIARYPRRFRIQDSPNKASIEDKETGARLRVLGNKPRSLHGLQPKLLVLDEIAQFEPTQVDAALAALETSRGKVPDSRAIWLGTRASTPEHPWEKALQPGGLGYVQVHSAGLNDPPFQRSTWKKANPGLNSLPDLEATIRREAKRAKQDPSALASFRALRLNLGVSDTAEAVLLDATTWQEIEVDAIDMSGAFVLGVDVGGSAAMTAASAYFLNSGGLDSFAIFPEEPGLGQRGLADGVGDLYVRCAQRGELLQAGQRVSDIGALLREVLRRWGKPVAITCDRWKEQELRQELEKVGFPSGSAIIVRGMGFQDGGADVRQFRSAVLDGSVHVRRSLLLRSAMSSARVVTDAAGNQKLAKGGEGRRVRARDDSVAASILAIAEGVRGAPRQVVRERRVVVL